MVVFGESWAYSVQGRKVDEILEFIKKNIENTHLEEGEDISIVSKPLENKVEELNKKYPKTIKYFVRRDNGFLRIGPGGGFVMRGICIRVIIVRPFIKGGEQ